MKIFKQFLIAVILAVLTLGLWLANYLGAFKDVDIMEAERGPYKMIYKDHTGSYHKIVQEIEQVEAWAKAHNVDCTESFGEYIDDANKVEEERLRSRGGCIVKEIPKDLPPEFKVREVPSRKYVVAVFEGSPGIGPVKVYPKAEKYMREKALDIDGSIIEIYVIHSQNEMTTTYLFPLAVPTAPTPGS